jgi:hypothetical protein
MSVCVVNPTGTPRLLAGLPFNLVSGTGMHWISAAFWPKHRTAYLYDPTQHLSVDAANNAT